jgi:dTDP-glucose 4,6-dehydratase
VSSLLVIGGTGFFGKSILDSYRRGRLQKWKITKVYIFARNADVLKVTNPELVSDSVALINGDIASCISLPMADYVIHAAASSDASKYIEAPEKEKKNILAGTTNFCKLAASKDAGASKILYVSSGAVYGSPALDGVPFSEGDKFISLEQIDENKRHYAAAKRDSEAHIIALGKSGSSVAIARCFAFVGKYLPRDQHFAIGNFIQNGLDQSPINIKAQKKVYRSYMYADDLVEWLMTIAESGKETCPIFNVGSDEALEIRELGALVGNFYNVPIKTKQCTEAGQDFYVPSVRKAGKELGLNINYLVLDAIKKINDQP